MTFLNTNFDFYFYLLLLNLIFIIVCLLIKEITIEIFKRPCEMSRITQNKLKNCIKTFETKSSIYLKILKIKFD